MDALNAGKAECPEGKDAFSTGFWYTAASGSRCYTLSREAASRHRK